MNPNTTTQTPYAALTPLGGLRTKQSALASAFTSALGICALLLASAAHADALQTLNTYLQTTKSGAASFTQTVTNTTKAGAAGKQSSGQFAFKRPKQFRFDYQKPFVQTIVADGKTLWMYDADLNQATQSSQNKMLDATPAALVASANNIQSLQAHFVLENAPAKDKLEWVKATPRSADAQLQSVLIGFEGQQLRRLDILDSFGQRSLIEFGNFTPLPAKTGFQYKPPAGADVIRQ